MTIAQQILIIVLVTAATMITRFLPFLAFPDGKKIPAFVHYLGTVLPAAVFGMLVVYCFRGVQILSGTHGIPELIAALIVIGLHLWKRQMLLSIAGGTIAYMLLVQVVF